MVACPICLESFKDWKLLEAHRAEQKHYYCYYCSEKFQSPEALKKHNRATHRKCRICWFVCRDKAHIDRHSEKDHVCCFSCNEVVRSAEELKEHFSEQHGSHCPHCFHAVANEAALLHHRMAARHWFFCSVCDEHFQIKELRDKHIIGTHWGCRYCDRYFKNATLLERHTKARHGCGCVNDVSSDCCYDDDDEEEDDVEVEEEDDDVRDEASNHDTERHQSALKTSNTKSHTVEVIKGRRAHQDQHTYGNSDSGGKPHKPKSNTSFANGFPVNTNQQTHQHRASGLSSSTSACAGVNSPDNKRPLPGAIAVISEAQPN